ncbi:hypothetical protein GF337_00830 [candidate division KSB1 bacterium]|nr:hypothetical protein [candidate division KSB1 bacterium]
MKRLQNIGIAFITVFIIFALILFFKKDAVYYHVKSNPLLMKIVYLFYPDKKEATFEAFSPEFKKNVRIEIDAANVIGKFHRFYNGIGMGTFNDGFRKPVNHGFFKLLAETNKDRRLFLYVNSKGIFMDESNSNIRDDGAHIYQVDDSGNVHYYWDIMDHALDNLTELDLKPIISLTFMPEKLASETNRRNPWNKGIITPPKDYVKWQELVYQTVNHLKNRYGEKEIANWYFEVWNEPDLFKWFWIPHPDRKEYRYKGDFMEYCKLYDYTVAGATEAFSDIKIGGPALAGDTKVFFEEFMKHCYHGKNFVTGKSGTKIDFISRHNYGGIDARILPTYKDFVERAKQIAGDAFKELDIIITETGPSTTPEPWLNTRYAAAWIVKEVAAIHYLADSEGTEFLPDIMCFWTKPVPPQFNNHFGLVTALGNKWHPSPDMIIKRPAFNGYEALGFLGDERLQLSGAEYGDYIHGVATKQNDSEVAVLLYHLDESNYLNTDSTTYNIELKIKNLPFSNFYLTYYKIDDIFSNGYSFWKKMGQPESPAPKYLKQLKSNDDLTRYTPIVEMSAKNDNFDFDVEMKSNSTDLIILSKREK